MKTRYQSKQGQKGEAEILLFITVIVACCVLSAAMWLLGWVRETKNAKVDRRALAAIAANAKDKAPFVPKIDPGEYYVTCGKSLTSLVNQSMSCEILSESYRELEVIP